ncbi:UDP-N-acetylglucosamine transferase subunit Alg14p [[Candida] railenensis]|uniref:UDP-N-acetylglucosamine transferase subunit ALG14 n=1 Tax=[Candida] railenensis TaxID=45579 RepID=A0A9P0QQ28_9ASCO|nr:UDP-N-acetylglucosamine transferase subunit Alg14p [[Candida] railenensis]
MNSETKLVLKVAIGLLPFFVLAIRLLSILPILNADATVGFSEILPKDCKGSNVMVLLGSGGHTGEMIRILENVDLNEFSRTWVTSSGDSKSILKCKTYEEDHLSGSIYSASFLSLHRARSVGEPITSSIKNTLLSFYYTFQAVYTLPNLPSVLLLNGPGTSVPLAYILFGLRFLGLANTRIIYIESLARVNSLSLSGKLLLPISDRFIVQWEQLSMQYKRAEYYGILL